MRIAEDQHKRYAQNLAAMHDRRIPWEMIWRELAAYIMPRRFTYLHDQHEKSADLRNYKILDGTGTLAARVLASGMMNGITSPARPWFKIRSANYDDSEEVLEWYDECTDRMLMALSRSNFYNAMATVYTDLAGFCSAAMLIYEDREDIFRCYNNAAGEYYFGQNNRHFIDTFARKFRWTVKQIVDEFGLENVSDRVKNAYELGGRHLLVKQDVCHLIMPNDGKLGIAAVHKFQEIYWEDGRADGEVLRTAGFREWPLVTARWSTVGSDDYGVGPALDALSDIKQLQHMTLRKAQGLDKVVSPPMVGDIQLQNRPKAFMPNGMTYIAGSNNAGARPAYQIQFPYQEVTADIREVQQRIGEYFYNPLFTMISNLPTVRSATEIDARREEKLVMLGPVLERFENEALDPSLKRIFRIMLRRGLFPPLPSGLAERDIEIEYVSVLADAQRAVGAAPIERAIAFVGNVAGAKPEALDAIEWPEILPDYFSRLGLATKHYKSVEDTAALFQEVQEERGQAAAIEQSTTLTGAAKNLSETEVGGGANALQAILGGGP